MAIKRTLRVNLRCPRHRKEKGVNVRIACAPCNHLAKIHAALLRLEAALDAGLRAGLKGPGKEQSANEHIEHTTEQSAAEQPSGFGPLFAALDK